jgi:hypothetical protein
MDQVWETSSVEMRSVAVVAAENPVVVAEDRVAAGTVQMPAQ